ncbi:unnamed protein product, partial [Ixodes hexagonus]
MCDGKYCPFGVASGLLHELSDLPDVPDVIFLNVNVDGLPLTKSTCDQFWPILCQVTNCGKMQPFPAGVYYGQSKALSANSFLEPFVSELEDILANGICIQDKVVAVKILAFVCDAPAKAYILSVVG